MSFLSSQYGWAANNVVDFEVVLANGTITHANNLTNTGTSDDACRKGSYEEEETHETDLFAALKGGGNNFGIVTQYTLQTQPISDQAGRSYMFLRTQQSY